MPTLMQSNLPIHLHHARYIPGPPLCFPHHKNMVLFLCSVFLLVSFATACDRCVHQTKAAYFSQDAALSSGACGYGSLALELSGGHLAGGVPSLYKNGAGCGACFQIRCKSSSLCTKSGSRVVLTDLNTHNETDFVLSRSAFVAMAQKGSGEQLLKLGILDAEFKRVPCEYKNKNLAVRVEESSKKPYYLAIKFLYEGGQTEIVGVDVAQVESSNWSFMSRNHGAVWDTSRVPGGALQMRIVVTSGYDGKWLWAKKVLPADWKTGQVYDTGVQISDIAQEGCSPCDDGTWP
ncbi:expansin-like A2 [Neltuma alba]|uniref:expansin-like A2 n=1 Tax=Neltuma alba TaxID=207710 RepID=UPI0010A31E22|nr:expansin-like A2 [Prosopis alba]